MTHLRAARIVLLQQQDRRLWDIAAYVGTAAVAYVGRVADAFDAVLVDAGIRVMALGIHRRDRLGDALLGGILRAYRHAARPGRMMNHHPQAQRVGTIGRIVPSAANSIRSTATSLLVPFPAGTANRW
ncbi:hypothetical protein GCM10020220_050600 [Nonomuraea rubra]